jgi:hypothetical protein
LKPSVQIFNESIGIHEGKNMKKFKALSFGALVVSVCLVGSSDSYADQPKPSPDQTNQVSDLVPGSTGYFAKAPSTSTKAATASTGYCYLQATNVHMATSIPGSIAADALITCSGTSIRISSVTVTLYKNGLIQHYLVGNSLAGNASTSRPFEYNIFKTNCSNPTTSTYWSKAVAYGTYADGSQTSATAVSPPQNLSCGTFF